MASGQSNHKICPKCGYLRTPDDMAPQWQCPKCQIAYDKYSNSDKGYTVAPTPTTPKPNEASQSAGSSKSSSSIIFFSVILFIVGAGYAGYSFYKTMSSYDSDIVTIYIDNSCPPCEQAVELLKEYEIEYFEFNISESDDNLLEYIKAGGENELPLTLIGRHKIEGYDEQRLRKLLSGILDDSKLEYATEVILFSKPDCSECSKIKEFLATHDIEHTEYDISMSMKGQKKFQEFGEGTVPLTIIGNKRIRGYYLEQIKMVLEDNELM